MSPVMAIARREWRSSFESPIAYIFYFVFVGLSLSFLYVGITLDQQASLRHLFEHLDWTLFVLVPPLAMRLWADELKAGTLTLLLTWPVTHRDVVLGKFVAAAGLIAGGLLLTLPATFMIQSLGDLDPGPVISGYIGAFFMGMAYLAVSSLIASFTRSQAVAFLASMLACLLLWLPGEAFVSARVPTSWVHVLQEIGFGSRFRHFESGLINLSDVVYYLSWTVLCLTLLGISFARHRRRPVKKLSVILMALDLMALNIWVWQAGLTWDATAEKRHSFSAITPEVINTLPGKARILLVASDQNQDVLIKPLITPLKDMLRHLEEMTHGRLDVTVINPEEDTVKRDYVRDQYGVEPIQVPLPQGGVGVAFFSVVIEVGTQSEVLDRGQLVRISDQAQPELANFESQLVRSLKRLSEQNQSLHQALNLLEEGNRLNIISLIDPSDNPNIEQRGQWVRQQIDDFVEQHSDRLRHTRASSEEIDVVDRFTASGLKPFDKIGYFHVAVENSDGQLIDIPDLVTLNNRVTLKKGLEKVVRLTLNQGGRQLGLMLPQSEGENNYLWLKNHLENQFTVRSLSLPLQHVPAGVGSLMIMGQQHMDAASVQALETYVAEGGNLILFTDPFDIRFNSTLWRYTYAPHDTGLSDLLQSWGVAFSGDIAILPTGVPMNWPKRVRGDSAPYAFEELVYNGVGVELDLDSIPLLKGLDSLMFSYPASLELSQSVPESVSRNILIEGKERNGNPSFSYPPGKWVNPFDADGQMHSITPPENPTAPVLAVTLEGAFPTREGLPPLESAQSRVVIVGDADFLSTEFYFSLKDPRVRGNHYPEILKHRFRENASLITRLVDWTFRDDALISISSSRHRRRDLKVEGRQRAIYLAAGLPVALLVLVGAAAAKRRRRGRLS